MQFHHATLSTCVEATNLVVAIDVLRAFSTAAYALAVGAPEILLVSSVEEALQLQQRFPGYLLMGEINGLPIPGFDFGNSPAEISQLDLRDQGLIQRTSAGTQGIVRSQRAEALLAASFVVAGATARAIQLLEPASVTFVITGMGKQEHEPDGKNFFTGDEDSACADYIERLLAGESPDPQPYLQRVKDSPPGRFFADYTQPEFPVADLELCTAIDRFDFALQVQRRDDIFVMNAFNLLI